MDGVCQGVLDHQLDQLRPLVVRRRREEPDGHRAQRLYQGAWCPWAGPSAEGTAISRGRAPLGPRPRTAVLSPTPLYPSYALLDYMLPSMEDAPEGFRSLLVETPHPDGPFGAKGVGEAGLGPVAPAIGNAVANALGGARVKDLPIRPDRVLAALRAGPSPSGSGLR